MLWLDFREKEKEEHGAVVPLTGAFTGCFLRVPDGDRTRHPGVGGRRSDRLSRRPAPRCSLCGGRTRASSPGSPGSSAPRGPGGRAAGGTGRPASTAGSLRVLDGACRDPMVTRGRSFPRVPSRQVHVVHQNSFVVPQERHQEPGTVQAQQVPGLHQLR